MSIELAILEAEKIQRNAALDGNDKVRVVAGPGSGKSKVIEDRLCWLLSRGVDPRRITVLSFTNASVNELRERIVRNCSEYGDVASVSVSTIHSLALKLLRAVGALERFPTQPIVLGTWELESIFDPEFGAAAQVPTKTRQRDIRLFHEAMWGTGRPDHPSYRPPAEEISEQESNRFNMFHQERTAAYACVLPGEIVNTCLTMILAGIFDPVAQAGVEHLIVDEFQDLNPNDLGFINVFIEGGVSVFVAGDDDQSIYSFRYATPLGLQRFTEDYPGSSAHELLYCFRCTPTVLEAATNLITSTQGPSRIEKSPRPIHSFDDRGLDGFVFRWRFQTAQEEANAIAESVGRLIQAGVDPARILILLRSKRPLGNQIRRAFEEHGVPFSMPGSNEYTETSAGRALLGSLRIICEGEEPENKDFMAHRLLLGLQPGIGPGKCNSICQKVIQNNLNFRELFYNPIPSGIFTPSEEKAIQSVHELCVVVSDWSTTDTLTQRFEELSETIDDLLGSPTPSFWTELHERVPGEITLAELRDLIRADNDELQQKVLRKVLQRLGDDEHPEQDEIPRPKIMSMHSAKGLSGQIVFIPGLEEGIIPAPKTLAYPGLVQEEARLLYVATTRTEVLCVLSYSSRRFINGTNKPMIPSRFVENLGGAFTARTSGLTESETEMVTNVIDRLHPGIGSEEVPVTVEVEAVR